MEIDLYKLHYIYNLINIDYFNTIPNDVLLDYIAYDFSTHHPSSNTHEMTLKSRNDTINRIKNGLSKSEMKKYINIINEVSEIEILDHIRFRDKILIKTGKKVKFSFRNKIEFQSEHLLLSKIITELNKNTLINIVYNEELIKIIEEPIKIVNDVIENIYNVVLLKNCTDYTEEGLYQKHCVGGYIRDTSHIISIRRNDLRCTVEYGVDKFMSFSDKKVQRKQAKMVSNQLPSNEWVSVLKILDNRIDILQKENDLLKKETVTVPKINNTSILEKYNLHLDNVNLDEIVDTLNIELFDTAMPF